MRRVLIVFLLCCTAALNYINVNPAVTTGNPEEPHHVQYGTLSCEEYDYYLPTDLSGTKNIVFMIHGGAWFAGDGAQFDDDCVEAAKKGFIAVNMDHRKFQHGADAFDMVKDVQLALNSLKKQLDSRGIKVGKMAMAGWSSGAHLTLMYAYEHAKESPYPIAFICVNSPPTDFLYDSYLSRTLMGEMAFSLLSSLSGEIILPGTEKAHMDAVKSVTPIYMVKNGVAPTIIVQGDDDDVVPTENSKELYSRLQKAGVDSVLIFYKGAGHFLGASFKEGNRQRSEAFMNFAGKYF